MKFFANDPFSLMSFHRFLIGTAVVGCLVFGAVRLVRSYPSDPGGAVLEASIAFLLAIGLVFYLRHIRAKK